MTDNKGLCTSGKSCDTSSYTPGSFPNGKTSQGTGKRKNKKLGVILGTTIPSGLLASALVSLYAWIRHKRNNNSVAAVSHHPAGYTYSILPYSLLLYIHPWVYKSINYHKIVLHRHCVVDIS